MVKTYLYGDRPVVLNFNERSIIKAHMINEIEKENMIVNSSNVAEDIKDIFYNDKIQNINIFLKLNRVDF